MTSENENLKTACRERTLFLLLQNCTTISQVGKAIKPHCNWPKRGKKRCRSLNHTTHVETMQIIHPHQITALSSIYSMNKQKTAVDITTNPTWTRLINIRSTASVTTQHR